MRQRVEIPGATLFQVNPPAPNGDGCHAFHHANLLKKSNEKKALPVFSVPGIHRYRTCPSPMTYHFSVTSFSKANGPRACSFCVEMPISAPRPNSPPSVKRVEALAYTAAASTRFRKRSVFSASSDTMHSECLDEYSRIWASASSKLSTTLTEHLKSRNSRPKSSGLAS